MLQFEHIIWVNLSFQQNTPDNKMCNNKEINEKERSQYFELSERKE